MPQVKFDLSNKMGVLSYKIDSWAMFRLVQGNSFLFVLVFSHLFTSTHALIVLGLKTSMTLHNFKSNAHL